MPYPARIAGSVSRPLLFRWHRLVLLGGVVLLLLGRLSAQRPASHDRVVVIQTRIDLRELGYPPLDVIPAGESAIRSLAADPGRRIYGATSGAHSHLFVVDFQEGNVRPLGRVGEGTTIHHSLVVDDQGKVYLGTSAGVDNNGAGYQGYPGGHLLRYDPATDSSTDIRVESPCPVDDLGIPVPGEGIYALTIDQELQLIYGLTYPGGHFFSDGIAAARLPVPGRVAEPPLPAERLENELNIGRALTLDSEGNVFTTGEGGAVVRFQLESQELQRLRILAPTAPGRETYNRVDSWANSGEKILYGGTSDGYLFRLEPSDLTVENLGKPLNQYRIRGLVQTAKGGILYGIGGDDEEMARLFSYDPASGAYRILGMIDVNRRPYYSWHGYVFDSMVLGQDGTLYLGQAERKSKLYLFYPY